MDLISIGVAAYNASATLKKCIDSLLSQTYGNIEIIIVNDCSTDSTAEICSELSHHARVRVIYNTANLGAGETRNRAIEAASGKYICFVDSDDYVEKNYIEALYRYAEKYKTVPVCGFVYHNEYENYPPVDYKWSKEQELVSLGRAFELNSKLYLTALWNKLFLLENIKKHNIRFSNEIVIGEDLRFTIDYLKAAGPDMLFVFSDTLYHYTKLSGNTLMADFGVINYAEAVENLGLIKELALAYGSDAEIQYEQAVAEVKSTFIYFTMRSDKLTSKQKKDKIYEIAPELSGGEYMKIKLNLFKERVHSFIFRRAFADYKK